MEKEDIILGLLKEVRDSQKATDEKVGELKNCIVGEEKCSQYRAAYDLRLRTVEGICSTLMTDRENSVDGEDLLIAKNDVIQVTKADIDRLDSKINTINDKLKVLDFTWSTVKSNPVLLTTFIGGGLMFLGVISGRGYDLVQLYGAHAVLLGASVVLLGIVSAWLTRRRAKQALKKLGVIHVLLAVMLIPTSFAQENDSEIITIFDSKPIMIPDLAKNCNTLAEELLWLAGIRAFLGNDSLNLTNSSGLFYA